MGEDAVPGAPLPYGPSLKYLLVNLSYFLAACGFWHLGLLPLKEAAKLHASGASWQAHLPWALRVVTRNFVLVWLWYGGWHHLLYTRRVCPERKFNKEWSLGYLYSRDHVLTLVGSMVASLAELAQVAAWASGTLPFDDAPLMQRPARNLLWMAFAMWYMDVFFFVIHRLMHPWFGGNNRYDVGALLYRHVHALHHKSYNPGPWSGLAMHPVEHLLYFSRGVCQLVLPGMHPVHFVYMMLRAMLGPALSHHGFDGYLGYKFHYLHHAKFEVNFGSSLVVPIDNVLGYYSTSGVAQREKADTSARALAWAAGLPYLVPLACLACLVP